MASQMEYTKDVILALLYAPDKSQETATIRGRTRLMKMLFLLRMEQGFDSIGVKDYYVFHPYKFGPFCPEVYKDVEFLDAVGIIQSQDHDDTSPPEASEAQYAYEEGLLPGDIEDTADGYTEPTFALTPKGAAKAKAIWESLPQKHRDALSAIKKSCNSVSLTALLRYVYREYPDFASESELRWLRQ